jgi:dihydrofolate reductase
MLVDNRADMRHFVRHTKGHTVLMGRKTLESFPGGQPLKGRRNVVITRDPGFAREGVDVAHSIDDALAMVADDPEVWLIGGGMIYRELLPLCTRAEITKNHCVHPADTFFPNLDEDPTWHVASSAARDDEGNPLVTPEGIPFEFVTYTRE